MKINKNDLGKLAKQNIKINNREVTLPKASFLFVTYNRCPYQDPKRNPLTWAIQSLQANNQVDLVDDYVIVDDCSNDYTRETVDWLRKEYQVSITYHRNPKRQEYSTNRRHGITLTKNNLVFMGDDDCLFSPNFIVGGLLSYHLLQKKYPKQKIAVVNFPVYEKNPLPKKSLPSKDIGQLRVSEVFFSHNFDAFPIEHLYHPTFLNPKIKILRPMQVKTFSGVNLSNKQLILKAGNYLDLSMWRFGYSEHLELSYQINRKGYIIYHQPDPRISSIHLKYGAHSQDIFDKRFHKKKLPGLHYTLGQLVNAAQRRSYHTGSRSSDEEFHMIEIGTLFSFYLKISAELAIRYAHKEYEYFVRRNHTFSTTPSGIIKSPEKRAAIWRMAIQLGCRNTSLQTNRNYKMLEQKIINETN